MNIDKIKNYNQKMLAVFGTLLVVLLGIGIISILIFTISDLIPNSQPNTNDLLSDEKVEALKKDSLRQQIISYDSPQLVDTVNLIYVLPVSVKTLDTPENTEEGVLGLLDSDSEMGSRSRKFKRRSYYYNAFNNLIVYDYKNQLSEKICDYRLIGTDLMFKYFDDEIIMVFTGAEKDTNEDHKITLQDFKSLFVYSLNNKQLKKISMENSTVNSFEFVEGTKDILVSFGFDRNTNDQFETAFEPEFVMKYDYAKGTLNSILDKGLEIEIQRIIDKN